MTRLRLIGTSSAIALVLAGAGSFPSLEAPASAASPLAAGNPAPPFSLMGSDGRIHKLSDSLGKQAVVIAWFAKAFSGG